ncbi:MAG TPA: DUF1611 domain-containing protein, partial [Candidatus Obscuribacterales bacterium]
GIAPSGGILPEAWRQEIQQAIAAGISVANGLHTPWPKTQNSKPSSAQISGFGICAKSQQA